MQLSAQLGVVCGIRDEGDVSGVCVFSTPIEETRKIYDEDPCVKAGIFRYEIHQRRSFPGEVTQTQDHRSASRMPIQ